MIHAGNIILYVMGWGLYVAGQAQNSIRSTSNGLTDSFEGWRAWLRFHLIDLANRAFWSGLFYGLAVHSTAVKLQALGFPITTYMVAGAGGFFANAFVYQAFGLLGIKRVEMGEKVPPPNSQIVAPSPPAAPLAPPEAKP
jgi:hypothetical protein